MSRRNSSRRGTTLVEVLVAVFLLTIIFLFITSDLIQASQAENVSATRTESMDAANYLLGVMRTDHSFWGSSGNPDDWATGPGGNDPCGNPFPAYTDKITAPTWHPAPACTPNGSNPGIFPDMVGQQTFQYMWNAQNQGGNPGTAQLTVWVQVEEGGRVNVYELNSTKGNIHAQPTNTPVLPTPTPKVTTPPPSHTPSPPPSPTPSGHGTPTPHPTHTPAPSPTPTPQPSGTFE